MRYTAYHLQIDSELALPELSVSDMQTPADVVIRRTSVSMTGLPDAQRIGPMAWAAPDSLWLEVPGVARFLIRQGREIIVDPAPDSDADSVRVFLLGSALGALLHQRGLLVLHGNAIRIGDQCLVCVGPSGAGKSTLAAAFLQRGHTILADDVVPVDAQGRALPGVPRLKLWKDVAKALDIDTATLLPVRPKLHKFNFPLPETPDIEALPVRWVYVLSNHHGTDVQLELITGMARFQTLHANTYRMRFLNGMAGQREHLRRCGELAAQVRLGHVRRPKSGFSATRLVDALLADVADHP